MHDVSTTNQTRNLSSIVNVLRRELTEFVNTRIEIVKSELRETIGSLRVTVPLGAIALVLFGTGFLLFSAAAVVLVASAFSGDPYAWFYACAIVGVVWIAMSGIAGFFAYNEVRTKGMFPKRTLGVLKADREWIGGEARVKHDRAA